MYWGKNPPKTNRQEGVGRREETGGFWPGASGSSAVPAPLSRRRRRGREGVPGKDAGLWGRGGWRQSKAQPPHPERKKPGSPGPARPGSLRQDCHRAAPPAPGDVALAGRQGRADRWRDAMPRFPALKAHGRAPAGLPDPRLPGKGLPLWGPGGGSSARCPPAEGRKAPARLTWKGSTFPQLFQSPILFTPC